jgi:peptidoglycan hydrolase-like protein with peptidoglycan-binding domain
MALPTLQQGSQDKTGILYVHRVQVLVAGIGRWNKLASAAAVHDSGTFDASTTAGVKQVQGFFHLTPDGVVGPNTWHKLIGA